MDEAKRVLDNPTVSTPHLLVGYKNISLSLPLVDMTIGQDSSLVDPIPSEIQNEESIPDETLVMEPVDLIPPVGMGSPNKLWNWPILIIFYYI